MAAGWDMAGVYRGDSGIHEDASLSRAVAVFRLGFWERLALE